jgi:hypothetical protein
METSILPIQRQLWQFAAGYDAELFELLYTIALAYQECEANGSLADAYCDELNLESGNPDHMLEMCFLTIQNRIVDPVELKKLIRAAAKRKIRNRVQFFRLLTRADETGRWRNVTMFASDRETDPRVLPRVLWVERVPVSHASRRLIYDPSWRPRKKEWSPPDHRLLDRHIEAIAKFGNPVGAEVMIELKPLTYLYRAFRRNPKMLRAVAVRLRLDPATTAKQLLRHRFSTLCGPDVPIAVYERLVRTGAMFKVGPDLKRFKALFTEMNDKMISSAPTRDGSNPPRASIAARSGKPLRNGRGRRDTRSGRKGLADKDNERQPQV